MHLRHSGPVLPQRGAPLAIPVALVWPPPVVSHLLLRPGDREVQADARQGPAPSKGGSDARLAAAVCQSCSRPRALVFMLAALYFWRGRTLHLRNCKVQANARQGPAASTGVQMPGWQQWCANLAAAPEHLLCSSWQPYISGGAGLMASRGIMADRCMANAPHSEKLGTAAEGAAGCGKLCWCWPQRADRYGSRSRSEMSRLS